MKYNLLIISFLIFLVSCNCVSALWLDNNYDYRKNITLMGNTSGAQTNYQLLLNVTYDSDMQPDFDDLRFCNETHKLDSWLESKVDSSYALVWVEFPTTPADTIEQTYYMYYGNTGAVSNWDIGATFLFGDDFPGASLDTAKWNTQGTVPVSSSEASLNEDDVIYSKDSWGYNHAVKAKAKADEQDTNFIGFRDGFGVNPTNGLSIQQSDCTYPDDFDRFNCWASNPANDHVIDNQLDFRNVYRTYEITRISGESKYYQDENLMYTRTTSLPTGNIGVGASVWDSSQVSTLILGWIFVRKYAANPPTYAFGSEEYYIPPTPTTLTDEIKLITSEITTGLKGINMGNYLVYAFILIGILLIILGIQIITNNIYRR